MNSDAPLAPPPAARWPQVVRVSRWLFGDPGPLGRPIVVLALGLALALGSVTLSGGLRQVESAQIQRGVDLTVQSFHGRLRADVTALLASFVRLGERWGNAQRLPAQTFEVEVAAYMRDHPEIMAIGWLDQALVLRRQHGAAPHYPAIGSPITMDETQRENLALSAQAQSMDFSPIRNLGTADLSVDAFLPVTGPAGRADGFLILSLHVPRLLDRLTADDLSQGYATAAYSEDGLIYHNAPLPVLNQTSSHIHDGEFLLNMDQDDRGWRFYLWLTPAAAEAAHSLLPDVVMWSGLAFSVLVSMTLMLLRLAFQRQAELLTLNEQLEVQVGERQRAEQRLERLATHDTLTQLPNRYGLEATLSALLKRADIAEQGLAVLVIDLDRFKDINDALGHDTGDGLITRVARRLTEAVGPDDYVARLGGDEFVVITHQRDEMSLRKLAAHLQGIMESPIDVDGHLLFASHSTGIAIYPEAGTTVSELISHADVALYSAKDSGRKTYRIYDAAMQAAVQWRIDTGRELRHAFDNGELFIAFQPRIELGSGRVRGAEALLRWRRRDGRVATAGEFIEVAEHNGLIIEIGAWVLREAVRGFQAVSEDDMTLSVNVSGHQFREADFCDRIADELAASGFPPHRLEVELTEHVLIENVRDNRQALTRLQELGVGLVIDDFGVGYSSLSYLRNFPVSALKVDRSFVLDLDHDSDDQDITVAIVAMARSLGLLVVAEGVETAQQRDFLRRAGCHEAQGYLYSAAVPAADWAEVVARLHSGR